MFENGFPNTAKVLILHPGKMGSSIGQAIQRNGHTVLTCTKDRSESTKQNIQQYGFHECSSYEEAFGLADVVISICMGGGVFPNADLAVKNNFTGIFVDANFIGLKDQEQQLAQILTSAGMKYVEGSIYGWPYPHESDGHAERIFYLTGDYAPIVNYLVHGDIFTGFIMSEDITAKDMKRLREEKDRQNIMPHTDHGCGIVEFHNVLDIEPSFILPWLERRRAVEPHDYYIDDNGFYVNRGGYRFTESQIKGAPERYMNLKPSDAPDEDIQFHSKLEKAMFDCINAYSNIYPESKDCLWWRTDAHVAVYGVGAGMGLHHDNSIGGASANENPLFNVVSGSLILWDGCDGGELQFRFIKNSIKPKNGSAVFYPSSYMGSHAVSKITDGLRISYLEFFGHGSRPGQVNRL